MPQVKQVDSLYSSCLKAVVLQLNFIYERKSFRKQFHKKYFKLTRSVFLNDLHGGIRQDLLKLAVELCRNDVWKILSFIKLLGDASIRKLVSCHRDDQLLVYEWTKLLSCLKSSNIIGLEELVIKVNVKNNELSPSKFTHSYLVLYKTLQAGLSKSLHSLILRSSCNNQVLAILGRGALHLTYLDVSNSWLVDDHGIRGLLLKEPNNPNLPYDVDFCECVPFEELNKIKDSDLNLCCSTLSEVRIQDTNTSCVSVIMMLSFIKTLKSVGGFIYNRNVGDTILTVKSHKPELKLNLTELFDTSLPEEKLLSLSELLPNLNTLYTRASFLPTNFQPFPLLTVLIVDFDFSLHKEVFFPFLKNNGKLLKKLALVDQSFSVDLILIAKYCPKLREIAAKVCMSEENLSISMPDLETASFRVNSAVTLRWILTQAPNLICCKVCIEDAYDYTFNHSGIDNKFFSSIVKECPAAFKSLEELIIIFWDVGLRKMDFETAKNLIKSCKKLKHLGNLDTWRMEDNELCQLLKNIQSSNWDLQISYSYLPKNH